MGFVFFFFEIPIVGIVLALTLVLGIDVGWLCRWIGSYCAVIGVIFFLWFPFLFKPWKKYADLGWGSTIFLMVFVVLFLVIPGQEVYKVGVGMGDKVLMELLLGR